MSTTQKLSVLQVLPSLISGGVERGTVDIAKYLVEQGHHSVVTSSGGPLTKYLDKYHAKHIRLPLNTKNPIRILLNAFKIAKIIRDEGIDIVHARSRGPAWSAYLACKITKCKFLATFHGNYSLPASGMFRNLKKKYNAVMLKGPVVIAVSEYIKHHIIENYAPQNCKITVIHRGVDLKSFDPEMIKSHSLIALKQKYPIPDDKLIITMPGRLTEWKGHKVLLEALHKLKTRDFCCLIVGNVSQHPSYYKELQNLIKDLELENNVVFTGAIEDMPTVYMLSDMVIAPSTKEEAFGRIPIEAQSMGKIVIATNIGGFTETIEHGKSGFLVPPNDANALYKAIEHVIKLKPAAKKQLAADALKSARNFSLEKMQKDTLTVYKSLL